MSYHTWHNYGYGINFSDLKLVDDKTLEEKFRVFAQDSKNGKDILEVIDENRSDYSSFEELADSFYEFGLEPIENLAGMFSEIIKEKNDIDLCCCENFDGDWFIIFEPFYPWNKATDTEKNLTEEKLEKIFKTTLAPFTQDGVVNVCYQECENGG